MPYLLLLSVTLLAVGSRLVPHPWNLTPVFAVAMFGGAVLPRRAGWLLPVPVMFATDVVLNLSYGFGFGPTDLVRYACLLLAVWFGVRLATRRTWLRTIGLAATTAVVWHLTVNFAVWCFFDSYPPTLAGLVECYRRAVPFDLRLLLGTLAWSVVLFGAYDWCIAWKQRRAAAEVMSAL